MVESLVSIDPVLASLVLTAVGVVIAFATYLVQRRSNPKKIPRYDESLRTPEDATKFARWLIKNFEKTVYINIHLYAGAGGRATGDTDPTDEPRFAFESAVAGYYSPDVGITTEETGLAPGQRALIIQFTAVPGRKSIDFDNYPIWMDRWRIRGACAPVKCFAPHQGYWFMQLEAREVPEIPKIRFALRKRWNARRMRADLRRPHTGKPRRSKD